ncbi:hypothetical protein Syun_021326 [Stephania yunnanensis]|uniref:CCHC-type domain-containing protein n=1 Tax=Stephania yunnanensis TaxID=152371 RepID=A0AAP0IFG1_9MAGN
MAEAVATNRVKVSVKCRDRDRSLVRHKDRDKGNMFHTNRDFNVSLWECGQPGHFTNRCSQQREGTTELGADSCYCRARMLPWHILMGGDRWCVSLLGDLGGAQLVAEEPSPTE